VIGRMARRAANQGSATMRKLIITAVAASALIAVFGASSVAVSGPSRLAAPTMSDLHQPVRIGEAGRVLRRMP
jgi:hypothetical protein